MPYDQEELDDWNRCVEYLGGAVNEILPIHELF
jgi:hypothetical protein